MPLEKKKKQKRKKKRKGRKGGEGAKNFCINELSDLFNLKWCM